MVSATVPHGRFNLCFNVNSFSVSNVNITPSYVKLTLLPYLQLFLRQNQPDALISEIDFWNETCERTCITHIPLLCVRCKTRDDGQRDCLKHVEFHSKNKFEKSVHLVGFIIRKFITMHGHVDVKILTEQDLFRSHGSSHISVCSELRTANWYLSRRGRHTAVTP